MANILYAKVGLKLPKAMWGGEQSGRSWSSGHDDDVRFLINVSYNNPDDTFYIIGNNSFDEISPRDKDRLFPHNNVVDAFDYNKHGRLAVGERTNQRYKIPMEYLNENNIVVDYGIIASGPIMDRNIPEKTKTKKGTLAKPLDKAKNFTAPVIHTLNETGVKWVALCDDPRCVRGAFDLFNNPPIVLSQIDTRMSSKHVTSYDDLTLITSEIEVKYAHVESTVVMDEKVNRVDDGWLDRTNNFSIALNGGMNNEGLDQSVGYDKVDNRYGLLKEWVLDHFDDCEVFGKWGDDVIASDKRFMGSVDRSDLYPMMCNWKHSLCIPIKKGWATSKYLECLKSGVSPFLHPNYDTEKNTKLQDFYRVDSTADLMNRIEGTGEDQHIGELNKAIDSCLTDEFTSGQYLNDEIYKHLGVERNITNVNRELWEVQIGSSTRGLSDFFV